MGCILWSFSTCVTQGSRLDRSLPRRGASTTAEHSWLEDQRTDVPKSISALPGDLTGTEAQLDTAL